MGRSQFMQIKFMIIGNTGLGSVAGWRPPDGGANEEKLVTVFNKFNPYLFAHNGAAQSYNSPNRSSNTR